MAELWSAAEVRFYLNSHLFEKVVISIIQRHL